MDEADDGVAVVVVGNVRSNGRTTRIGLRVAELALGAAGITNTRIDVVELSEAADHLFDEQSDLVLTLIERVRSARLVVVASPTFKGTYSGMLKAFLDRFARTELNGVTAIPVLVGATPAHALAVEVHLRPLLVEIGASLPTRGLYVLDSQTDELDAVLERWLDEAAEPLKKMLAGDELARLAKPAV